MHERITQFLLYENTLLICLASAVGKIRAFFQSYWLSIASNRAWARLFSPQPHMRFISGYTTS